MNNARVQELVNGMTSFNKGAYYKNEMLTEMFNLQNEMVSLTFNEEHAANSNLRIYDVENRFEKLNEERGHVADEELHRFKNGAKTLSKLISAEISGNRGESKAFSSLKNLRVINRVLTNVELKNQYYRTELDAVVITPSGITIVEVKNTARNIYIEENGEYFVNGDYMIKDSNIAQKNDVKERLLKEVLSKHGINNVAVRTVVVFTNDHIEVHNKCPQVKTTFVNMLPHVIEEFSSRNRVCFEEIKNMEMLINSARCREAYPADFDVAQFKMDFATLMFKLENASSLNEIYEEKTTTKGFAWIFASIKKRMASLTYKAAASVASVFLSIMAAAALASSGN